MRIQELLGMPVVAVDQGLRLGTVHGVELDPGQGQLRYLRVKTHDRRREVVIPWEGLRSIGRDAVTIDSARLLQETIPTAECAEMIAQFGNRAVVTESGTHLGHITGYDFDPISGAIGNYHVSRAGLAHRLMGRDVEFPQAAIRSVGDDAVIVADEVLPAKAA